MGEAREERGERDTHVMILQHHPHLIPPPMLGDRVEMDQDIKQLFPKRNLLPFAQHRLDPADFSQRKRPRDPEPEHLCALCMIALQHAENLVVERATDERTFAVLQCAREEVLVRGVGERGARDERRGIGEEIGRRGG